MPHTSNIQIFVEAANTSPHPLIRAYCGLVAVELVLKSEVGLKDHNVPAGLTKFRAARATGAKAIHAAVFNTMRMKLTNDLIAISSQKADGSPCAVPADSFPYLRYTRFDVDGWGIPSTTGGLVTALANTVDQLRAFLKQHFGVLV